MRPFAIAILIAAVCLFGINAVVKRSWPITLVWPDAHGFHISGQVVDESGVPVAEAHVVIVISQGGYVLYDSKTGYGILADSNGRFEANLKTDYSLAHRFSILVAGPNDLYAEKGFEDPTIKDGILTEDILITLSPKPDSRGDDTRYKYSTFRPIDLIEFLGPSW